MSSRIGVSSLFLVLTAAIAYFLILPQWQEVGRLRVEIKRLGGINAELDELVNRRAVLQQTYDSISSDDRAKLDTIAPATPQLAPALVDFEVLAQRSGVTISNIDISSAKAQSAFPDPAKTPGYGTLPVTLSIRGTYEAFRIFVAALERNLRLTDVTAVNFVGGSGAISVTIGANMYHRR